MFTGIVEEQGRVDSVSEQRLVVSCGPVAADSRLGDSIAVSGICLTVAAKAGDALTFDLSQETLSRTSLRRLRVGDPVNLERPVTPMSRLGGHIVQGHVDGVGTVAGVELEGGADGSALMSLGVPQDLMSFVVEKGSIAVDGVSLTVAALGEAGVTVALIPHTMEATTLGAARPGDPVNLEVDVIAKYVAKQVEVLMEGRQT